MGVLSRCKKADLPHNHRCTADGHTFERQAIEQWLQTHNTSPLTGLRLPTTAVTPNHALRSLLLQ